MTARRLVGPALLALALLPAIAPTAQAGPVLDRVRAQKAIRCDAAERPGLFETAADGTARGLLVDLCRAVGTLVAGPEVRVVMDVDGVEPAAGAMRGGGEDIAFLTGAEIVADKAAATLVPGPPVFFESAALMVPAASPAQHPADLAGQPICFLEGEATERHLNAFFAERHLPFVRMGYQEDVELHDAFDAGQCRALAGEATTLADVRLDGGPTLRGGRLLDEPLATVPVFATTGTADGAWSALVAWSVATLQNADRPTRDWAAGGVDALPLLPVAAGLADDWQRRLLAQAGSYGAMLRRATGDASPLNLPAGPNALVEQGGLLRPPDAE